jgi:hypothetical protein
VGVGEGVAVAVGSGVAVGKSISGAGCDADDTGSAGSARVVSPPSMAGAVTATGAGSEPDGADS